MDIYIYITIFMFGIVIGSFYNVLGYRLPKKESIAFPASHCVECNHKLGFFDLIPIFSYLFLGGKCRYCKKKISIVYPIIEFITGILFVLSYYVFGFSINFGISIIFSSVAIIAIASDIRYMVIEDSVLIVGAVLILILKAFIGLEEVKYFFVNGILTLLIVYLIKVLADLSFRKEAMGGGDVKLLGFMGALVPFPMGLITLCIAAFLGFPYALYIYFSKNEHVLPLGPFLCIGGLVIYFLNINFTDLMNLMAG